ncbi:MAG: undecaprenyldiphospho-muramoylpentapeptide beta-N-acetylglucosaminyltransferase [Lachnospiraceae bacterium]|nr:undecaprenyldiphospho-muramoylpentapeptide beta-N-acetylglucosaminyltransferase [Lachnospiraceae bacterium]
MPKVLLTGGGTAGHVTPNIALIPYLKERGFEIEYMGSYDGIEKKLIENEGIPYTGIDSGKLRRYASVQNLKDPHHILHGIREARRYMKKNRPDVVFSKGGFVAVPVVLAARRYRIPVVIHESDLSPGLANKICIPRANKICFSFPETEKYLGGKGIHTGLPVRDELLKGDPAKGREVCGFTTEKPVLMVIGGSLGSLNVNNAVRGALSQLLEKFQIVHICGAGKMDPSFDGTPGYVQFEYVSDGLNDLMAMSDVFISRAGANVICELAALKKPNVLIPLGTDASRGDQILNAESFEKRGFSHVLLEQDLNTDSLIAAVAEVFENKDKYIDAMEKAGGENAARMVADIIAETAGEPVPDGDTDVSDEEIMAAHMEEDKEQEEE